MRRRIMILAAAAMVAVSSGCTLVDWSPLDENGEWMIHIRRDDNVEVKGFICYASTCGAGERPAFRTEVVSGG